MAEDSKKIEILEQQRQVIIYGAPGTGKSYFIKEKLKNVNEDNVFRTTFHPDSDYSTFVGAYKPTMEGDVIKYKFVPQAFLKAYVRAYQASTETVYLIIEEINRGNCAQIFGDIFQLLDRNDKGRSEYEIDADEDIKAYLEEKLGKDSEGIKGGKLCLPSNLYIYATMNTSDQSLFPIDSAFKRRWYWVYSPIQYNNSKWVIKIGGNTYSWTSFQKIVNEKIHTATNSEDKMLGDFFVNPNNDEISEEMFRDKILFYLWNDVCKDGSGDIFVNKENKPITFSDLYDVRDKDGDNKLIAIMEHLGVEKKNLENHEQDSNEEDNTSKTYKINNEDKDPEGKNWTLGKIVLRAVELYWNNHNDLTAQEVRDEWNKANFKIPHIVETKEDKAKREEGSKDNRLKYRYNELKREGTGETLYVSTQVSDNEDSNVNNFNDFMDKVKKLDPRIEIEPINK